MVMMFTCCTHVETDQDSVYGRRDGALTGIAVVHSERSNVFRKTPLWKLGVVDSVQMCPRSQMYKPEVPRIQKNMLW